MNARTSLHDRQRDIAALLLLAVGLLAAQRVGLRSISPLSPLSPLWPPAGVLLGAFLLLRRDLWGPALGVVIAVDFISNVMSSVRPWIGAAYLVPSLIELATALWVVRRLAGAGVNFRRVRDTFALAAGASIGALLSGLLAGALAVWTASAPFARSVLTWWTADVLGMLLLTPMLVAWVRGLQGARTITAARMVEGALFAVALAWSTDRAFRGALTVGRISAHPYMLAPFMVWAAFRLGVRGTTAAITGVAAIAIHVVLTDPTAFSLGGSNISEQLLLVQVYLVVMGLTGLLLASALAEREAADAAARASGERLRLLADNLPNRVVFQVTRTRDGAPHFLHIGANADEVFGVTAAELSAHAERLYTLFSEPDLERIAGAERAGERNGDELLLELPMRRPDGVERWLMVSATPRDAGGERVVWDGIVEDITERRLDEQRLRRTNRLLGTITRCNQVLVRAATEDELLHSLCDVIVEDGGLLLAWVGYADEGEEKRVRPVAHAGHEGGYLDAVDMRWDDSATGAGPTGRAIRTGEPAVCHDFLNDPVMAPWRDAAIARGYRSSLVLPLRDGARVFGSLSVYSGEPGTFDADEISHLSQLADDLAYGILALRAHAEHARAEAALAGSEERFRQLAENIREVFWMMDARTNDMLYISPGVERLYGLRPEVLMRDPTVGLERIHPDDRDRVLRASMAVNAGALYDEEYRVIDASGEVHWVHGRAFPVRDASGTVYRVVGISDDITVRRRIEEQLRQVQKLEAIGQLAGGIAHDFNNIVAAIMMQAGMARGVPGLPAEASELLEDIDAAAQRASNLTRQLLLFSRKQAMQERALELNDLVATVIRMLRRVLPEHVQLQLVLSPRALGVHADPGMLEQVVLNLTVNARDAMPDGGLLTIETFSSELTSDDLRAFPGTAPGAFAGIRVRDTGCGISREHLAHIFDPFFTTKEPGKGTGLGLATVFGIVQQHRGAIFVQSRQPEGTTIEVLLPARDVAEPAAVTADGSLPPANNAQHTILVVEDDRAVRSMTQRVLERHGYRVHTANSGREALAEWDRYEPHVDLLLTDLMMPGGVDGIELASRLQAREPALRVVFSSGYDAEHGTRTMQLEPGVNFLQKPSTPRQILSTVGQMLDAE